MIIKSIIAASVVGCALALTDSWTEHAAPIVAPIVVPLPVYVPEPPVRVAVETAQARMPSPVGHVAPFVSALSRAGFSADMVILSPYCKLDPSNLPTMPDSMIPIDPAATLQFVSIDTYMVVFRSKYDSDSEILISCFGNERNPKQAKARVITPAIPVSPHQRKK